MARPIKRGLEYFSLDVNFFADRHIKGLKVHYGADGVVVYIYLLCAIYDDNGYYLKMDDYFIEEAADDLNMSEEKIGQIMNFLCKRSLLDGTLLTSDKVLTSHGIQKRYQEAVKARAVKNTVEVDDKYWLLSESETKPYIKVTPKKNNPGITAIIPGKNPDYSEEKYTKKSKVNKSKVNKSKVNRKIDIAEQPINQSEAIDASVKAYEKYIGIVTPKVYEGLNYYLSQGMATELVVRLVEYVAEQPPTKHSWQYLNAVLNGTLESGILTLDDYNRIRADFVANKGKNAPENGKKNKFNNYQPSTEGATDYAALEQAILDNMLDDIDN